SVEESPGFAAVGGDSRGRIGVIGFAIVAADDHALIPIAKGDRKNASRGGAGNNRGLANRPVFASILGMQDPRRFGSTRAEPDVVLAMRDQAGAAGSEGALVRQSRRQVLRRKPLPIRSTVIGEDQLKLSLYGVPQSDAVLVVPEGHGIKKALAVGVFELQD